MNAKAMQNAPKHLKPATRRWVRDVLRGWELEEHHRRILISAGEAWDRGTAAREVIERDGATYLDRFGQPKMRPEVLIERDMKSLFARLIRELDLDIQAPGEASRPPSLRSIRGRQ
jgi:hypothetical protein